MTEQELLKLDRVSLVDAAAYLQNGTKPLDIRVWAQTGTCPFCQCCYLRPSSKRRIYRDILVSKKEYKYTAADKAFIDQLHAERDRLESLYGRPSTDSSYIDQ